MMVALNRIPQFRLPLQPESDSRILLRHRVLLIYIELPEIDECRETNHSEMTNPIDQPVLATVGVISFTQFVAIPLRHS